MKRRRYGRLLIAALLAGVLTGAVPTAQAAPPAGTPGAPGSPPGEGPWPPASVLAADPATVPVPDAVPSAARACPAAGYGVNHYAPGAGKTVALTFDDGPGRSTAAILAILEDEGVAATFFNVGVNQGVRPALVRAEKRHGFLLGNHTWAHPDMATLTVAEQAAQIDDATAEQISLVGRRPCFFRPPYGSYDSTTLALAQARTMRVWNWSVDTEDWKAAGSASSYWVNRILRLNRAGGSQTHPVVLLHNPPAGAPATVAALPAIIGFYRSRGYTFVDLAGRVAHRTVADDRDGTGTTTGP